MKICFLITGLSVGGAEMMLYKLLKHSSCLRQGVVVSLVSGGEMARRIEALGVRVVGLHMRRGLPDISVLWRLVCLLRSEKFDLLSTWMYHADFLGGVAARLANLPVLWNIRNSDLDPEKTKWMTRCLARACASLSGLVPRRIISCSRTARDVHVRLGYRPEKFVIIPNGFDLNSFVPDRDIRTVVRNTLGIEENTPLVGLVARFDPQKNHVGFLDAACMVHDSIPQTHFVLAGTGVTWENTLLRQKIEDLGLQRQVHLLGPRTDIARLMTTFDVLASSSHGEAFPNVLGEAMACGVPCVATNAGDSAYIVGDTGKVVPVGDMHALAGAVVDVLSMSSAERAAAGNRARARVEELFEIGRIAKEYERVFEEERRTCAA